MRSVLTCSLLNFSPFSLCSLSLSSAPLFCLWCLRALSPFPLLISPCQMFNRPSKLTDWSPSYLKLGYWERFKKKGTTRQTRQESCGYGLFGHLQQLVLLPDQVSPGGSPHACWLGSKNHTLKPRNCQHFQVILKLSPSLDQPSIVHHFHNGNETSAKRKQHHIKQSGRIIQYSGN